MQAVNLIQQEAFPLDVWRHNDQQVAFHLLVAPTRKKQASLRYYRKAGETAKDLEFVKTTTT